MLFGLSPEEKDALLSVFKTYPEIEKVLLYGIRAKGNFTAQLPIELTLLGLDLTFSLRDSIEDALLALALPYEIEINLFEFIDDTSLIAHINRVGKVFYEQE